MRKDLATAKKNELKPWHVRSWVISEAGPDFVCAMEEVLDVYEARMMRPTRSSVWTNLLGS